MNKNKIALIATLASCVAGTLMAGNLTSYTTGDVLICFRNGGARDLVVDAGPISTFTNLTANQRYTISTYTGIQLGQVATNAVSWSAFTWFDDNTLFITKARGTSTLDTQTAAWRSLGGDSQNNTILRMQNIIPGATNSLYYNVYPASSSSAVVEDDLSSGDANYPTGTSYRDAYVGSYGANFSGTFSGNPENTTLSTFTTSGKVVRSDFYQLSTTPNAQGKLLGYFELNTNGVMTYVAYPSSTPVISSFSRADTTTTITYSAGIYGTYTLRGTNTAGLTAARTSWPAISTLTSGNHTVQDITTDNNRFYIITAQ